eukprot:CAMPEP_0114562680 /NCGR_PEP_ID=MMETSP0114-20121206/12667_1 /TAXON_ID=31324 /ORGANISM="Goniomonas sp, Strain m" /LENGTH=64 /DNA_ID=CAMNT_0001748399 /DNA_START=515 /DNA_END=709 /DNA_ORIENTATION=-
MSVFHVSFVLFVPVSVSPFVIVAVSVTSTSIAALSTVAIPITITLMQLSDFGALGTVPSSTIRS